jgi:uncharacterized protein YjbI with pentapeptide repeats
MANAEHLALVRKGRKAIDEWRQAHPRARLDLRGADLVGVDLTEADLSAAYLSAAKLNRAKLSWANLREADLVGAVLREANLSLARLGKADLSKANLRETILREANLKGANLAWADLSLAALNGAKFSEASLTGARLIEANLTHANLSRADLTGADLSKANLRKTDLRGANLSKAWLGGTSLDTVDLSQVTGLATVKHGYPSAVGTDTLVASVRGAGGHLTPELETFLRGAGVPQELLDVLPGAVAEIEHDSCFISYGQPDLEFAKRLYEGLKTNGVSCWVYDMDKTVGKRIWPEIKHMLAKYERMVVICSARALVRDAVLKEIGEQIDEEPDKLVPISLDDLWKEPGFRVMRGSDDLKPFLMNRNYADFAGWEADSKRYDKGLEELLRGLKREQPPE